MTQYKGTGITGTSTTAKVFEKSGVAKAASGDKYLNTTTGHNYKCTVAGNAKTAKWQYDVNAGTSILKAPTVGVTSLAAPERGSNDRKMTATWKVPDALVDAKKCDRAEKLLVLMDTMVDADTVYTPTSDYAEVSKNTSSRVLNLDAVRDRFYPCTKRRLYGVKASVEPFNSKGQGTGTASKSALRRFTAPRKPAISAPEWNVVEGTGTVTATITTNAGKDYRERYDTRYKVTVYDDRTGDTTTPFDSSSSSTSIELSVNIAGWGDLATSNKHVKVTFEAWARGFAGDSEHAAKSLVVSWPAVATIVNETDKENGRAVESTSTGSAGITVVPIRIPDSGKPGGNHPIDHIRLCKLRSTTATTASAAANDANWVETDIVDDGSCTSMAINVIGDDGIKPDPGTCSWLRLKSWHLDETQFHKYSSPVRVRDLETPAGSDNACTIVSAEPTDDGQGVMVTVGWKSSDGSKGGELSWSRNPNAWFSTDIPETFEFDWQETASGTWNRRATVEVRGLEEGETYYFKARRYDVVGDEKVYGAYSKAVPGTPAGKPAEVVLTAPAFVPRGSSVPYSWTFTSGSPQRKWILRCGGKNVAKGSDPYGSYVLDSSRASKLAGSGALAVKVLVSTGGDYVESAEASTSFADPPLAGISAQDLSAQPMALDLGASTPGCSAVVKVMAQGAAYERPDGARVQAAGDTVWSALLQPEWDSDAPTGETGGEEEIEVSAGTGALPCTATVELPEGLDFIDGAAYTAEVVLADPVTGLSSEPASCGFAVAWEHQAPVPSEEIALAPAVTTDPETGAVSRSVVLALAEPTGAAEDDVYDIYRMDGPNAVPVASGMAMDAVLTDVFAPFGDGMTLSYRIACRTADGDVEWADFDYSLDGACIRVDFGGAYVELPHNIGLGERRAKDFEKRRHMDGTDAGYWNAGVDRGSSLSAVLVAVEEQSLADAVRSLGDYAGAVFVRTPDGRAFCANVDVGAIETGSRNGTVSLDFSADEIALTDEYRVPSPAEDESQPTGATGGTGV
ncbi:MAG: hypothetical protein IKE55_09370 [Kiritimatiellae bacterium]|nr:hypothetical protein [Kiritimatiellia bacterium]